MKKKHHHKLKVISVSPGERVLIVGKSRHYNTTA